MSFVSRGDFMFPFEFGLYWLKHFYMWSYQTGATNIDGIIRLPSRFFTFIVFAASGNIAASYFYFFFSVTIVFLAFYAFAGHFLDIKNRYTKVLGALFFSFNPIFLGYIAKVGLIVGAAMLPLCLVVIRQAFIKRQFRYFVLYVLLLNVSFIHPFTLTINIVVSGLYLIKMLKSQPGFVISNKAKVLGTIAVGLILNAYFILPIMSLGTVSKNALSDNLNKEPVDYTVLVDFANTGDPFTAFSLSRNVLLDFRYYNAAYRHVYVSAVFIFYLVLLGLYIYNEQRLSKYDRKRIVMLFSIFLVLLLLSMSTFFDINQLIKFLIGLPGGWMFRSPLKWQLYIPFVLSIMLCLLLQRTTVKKIRRAAAGTIVATVVLMSAFLSVEIYRQLLTPSSFRHLAGMQTLDLDRKNLLFASDNECFAFLQQHLDVVTEMNQIFASNDLQVKRINTAGIDTINTDSYDYIFGCSDSLAYPLQDTQRFERTHTFANKHLALYQNKDPQPYIYTPQHVFALGEAINLSDKRAFTKARDETFDFATDIDNQPTAGLQDPFENLSLRDIQPDRITRQVDPVNSGQQTLVKNNSEIPLFYTQEGQHLTFSSRPQPGFEPLPDNLTFNSSSEALNFTYLDKHRRQNLIPNPSFESGMWQKEVWDCYDYDDQPSLDMKLHKSDVSHGKQALELRAESHIACTSPAKIAVGDTARYLLHFKYKSTGERSFAGYQVRFDDANKTYVTDYLPHNGGGWQEFSKEIAVPKDAKNLRLTLYAYPDNSGDGGTALFDDFTLLDIPDLQGDLYLTSKPAKAIQQPKHIAYIDTNPTKKQVEIRGASGPFYLAQRDTYHGLWQARVNGKPVDATNHLKLNGFMNGWYIDPAVLCGSDGCQQAADGSYDLTVDIVFLPQSWFYKGLVISSLGFLGVIGYFSWLGYRRLRNGNNRYWRWR